MTNSSRRDLFDRWAADYDRVIDDNADFPFQGYDAVLARTFALARVSAEESVLDVGAGTGNLTQHFVAAGCTVGALDFSSEMMERAQERFPGLIGAQADLTGDLPDLGRRFSRIVSSYVMHEFAPGPQTQVLRNLTDHYLEPGGWLVIADIAFPSAALRAAAAERWARQWDPSEHYWGAEEDLARLADAGFIGEYEQVSACAGVFVLRPS